MRGIINCLFFFLMSSLAFISACKPYYYKFDKYISYLDKDSTYKSEAEKANFDALKNHFIEVWLDSSNCLLQNRRDRGEMEREPMILALRKENVKEVFVDNILHSPNYDTLAVLVTWYSSWYSVLGKDSALGQRTESKVVGYIVDKQKKWHVRCNVGTFTRLTATKDIKELSANYREEVVTWRYFRKNKTVDPTFFHRLFTMGYEIHTPPPIIWGFFHSLKRSPNKEFPLR